MMSVLEIKIILENKKQFMDLLLLADKQDKIINGTVKWISLVRGIVPVSFSLISNIAPAAAGVKGVWH